MSLLPFLLRSLKYRQLEGFNPDDPAQFQAVVVWLENTKVRQYPIDGRRQLQNPDKGRWHAALRKYLADLEAPIKFDGSNQRPVLQWLLTHAGAAAGGRGPPPAPCALRAARPDSGCQNARELLQLCS